MGGQTGDARHGTGHPAALLVVSSLIALENGTLSRLPPPPKATEVRIGFAVIRTASAYGLTFLFPEGDEVIGPCLRDFGEFARPEVDLISDYLSHLSYPGTMIDVGANIGAIALPVAAALRGWRVIAYEAHGGVAQILGANALNNKLFNVNAIHAAVGAAPALAQFPSPPLNAKRNFGTLGFHSTYKMQSEVVRVGALDDEAPPDTRLVKVDVEGFEPEVLRGAARLIREVRPIWFLEVTPLKEGPSRESMATLIEAGYRLFWFQAPYVTPARQEPREGARPKFYDLNILALPEDAPNLWQLTPVAAGDAVWPENRLSNFRYMSRYGYKIGAPPL